ncbi:unnamed protein product [Meloidogyne enterolobii]|uniref:Uncharacterized protein n=1 Tax=Meloidogyne enterolobii TaxID=390850 RepID=A0ACB1AJS5_MELEN
MNYVQPSYGGNNVQYFGSKPQLVYCPICIQNTKTKIKFVVARLVWIMAMLGVIICLMSIMGAFFSFIIILFINNKKGYKLTDNTINVILPIVFVISGFVKKFEFKKLKKIFFPLRLVICILSRIPLCFECFKDAEHHCSVCDTLIGKYIRDKQRPIVILPPESYKNLPI